MTTASLTGADSGEGVEQPAVGQHVIEPVVERAGRQAQQALGLVVDHTDPAGRVDRDHPLANAVQGRFALLQQSGDLVELEAERSPLEHRRQPERCQAADGENQRRPRSRSAAAAASSSLDTELSWMPTDTSPTRFPPPRRAAQRVRRHPGRPRVDAQVRLAIAGDDRLADLLADQVGIRVGMTHPIHVDDDDIGGAGPLGGARCERLHLAGALRAAGGNARPDRRDFRRRSRRSRPRASDTRGRDCRGPSARTARRRPPTRQSGSATAPERSGSRVF